MKWLKKGQAKVFFDIIYLCTLYFLVKILLVKLKILHTLAYVNVNYGTKKTETKTVKFGRMVQFIETYDQCPRKFNFSHFFSSIILCLSARGKIDFIENTARVKWVIFFCLREIFS